MKIKVKPREAFIIYQALNARISTLKVAEKNNKKLATQVQTTLALRDRLFPAPVVIPNEEEA
ncbi:MAG TPA: hypothetical protein VG057_07570 [Solirubrobacteraceae bacterium]|jgi:hypothetical protein|nr:hypothetical protein [Solirubrobacteraceae bacterium]